MMPQFVPVFESASKVVEDYYAIIGVLPDTTKEELESSYLKKAEMYKGNANIEYLSLLHSAWRTLSTGRDEYDDRLREIREDNNLSHCVGSQRRYQKRKKIAKMGHGKRWESFQKAKKPTKRQKLLQDAAFFDALVAEKLKHVKTRLLPDTHDWTYAAATGRRRFSVWPEFAPRLRRVVDLGLTRTAALKGLQARLEGLPKGPQDAGIATFAEIAREIEALEAEADRVTAATREFDALLNLVPPCASPAPANANGANSEEDMIRLQLGAVLDDWCKEPVPGSASKL